MSLFSTRTTTPRERLLEIITAGTPLSTVNPAYDIPLTFVSPLPYDRSPHFADVNDSLGKALAYPLHEWGKETDLPGFFTAVLDKADNDSAITAAALELRTHRILESTAPKKSPIAAYAPPPNPYSNAWACIISAQHENHDYLLACADVPNVVGFLGLASTLSNPPLPVPSTLDPIPAIAPARAGAWNFDYHGTIKLLILYALTLGQPAIAATITNDVHAGIFIDGFGSQRPDLQVDSYVDLVSRLPHSTLSVD